MALCPLELSMWGWHAGAIKNHGYCPCKLLNLKFTGIEVHEWMSMCVCVCSHVHVCVSHTYFFYQMEYFCMKMEQVFPSQLNPDFSH